MNFPLLLSQVLARFTVAQEKLLSENNKVFKKNERGFKPTVHCIDIIEDYNTSN